MRVPEAGYCVALRGGGDYVAAFAGHRAEGRACYRAQVEANERREGVDVFRVLDRGGMRYVVAKVEPEVRP